MPARGPPRRARPPHLAAPPSTSPRSSRGLRFTLSLPRYWTLAPLGALLGCQLVLGLDEGTLITTTSGSAGAASASTGVASGGASASSGAGAGGAASSSGAGAASSSAGTGG